MAAPTIGTFTAWSEPSDTGSVTVPQPAGVQEDDFVVIFLAHNSSEAVTAGDAGTEVLLELRGEGQVTAYIFGRIATASEPATYGFSHTGTSDWMLRSGICVGADQSNFPTSVIDGTSTGSTGGVNDTSVTVPGLTVVADALLLGHVVTRATTTTITSDGSVMSPLWATGAIDAALGSTRSFEETPASGATGDRIFDLTDSTLHHAGLLSIAPAAGGGGGATSVTDRSYPRGVSRGVMRGAA